MGGGNTCSNHKLLPWSRPLRGGAYESNRYSPPDGSTPREELMIRTGIPPLMGQISGSVYASITRGASHTNKTSHTSSLQPGWLTSSSSRPVGLSSSSSSSPRVGVSSSSSSRVGLLSSSSSRPVGLS